MIQRSYSHVSFLHNHLLQANPLYFFLWFAVKFEARFEGNWSTELSEKYSCKS